MTTNVQDLEPAERARLCFGGAGGVGMSTRPLRLMPVLHRPSGAEVNAMLRRGTRGNAAHRFSTSGPVMSSVMRSGEIVSRLLWPPFCSGVSVPTGRRSQLWHWRRHLARGGLVLSDVSAPFFQPAILRDVSGIQRRARRLIQDRQSTLSYRQQRTLLLCPV